MIVVKVEVWPHGEASAFEIDRVYIWNDDTGTATEGNYQVRVHAASGNARGHGAKRKRIFGWPRSRSALALVREALKGLRL
jgi:hypothetical protein